MTQTESELIRKALEGEQQAFKKLYDRHVDALFAFLYQFAENRESVKDWTQKSFSKAFLNIHQFKKNSTFKTWLFSIALNVMRTEMRSKVYFHNLEDTDLENTLSDVEDDKILDSEKWLMAKDAIRSLDAEKRMIVLLHIAEGHSHDEIAEMLNITPVNSRVILHRSKKELKDFLKS